MPVSEVSKPLNEATAGRTAYIAGPMTNRAAYNAAAFGVVARRLEEMGFVVRTPFEANSRAWKRHYGRDFDPATDRCDYGDPLLREMFAEDIAALLRSDCIVLLPDWHKSKGATLELSIARLFGLEVLDCYGDPYSESILEEAQRLVHGDRGDAYGHPIDDYTCTGRVWAALLDRWLRQQPGFEDVPPLPDIDPRIAALMMAGMKLSREAHKHKRDNAVDTSGYAECVQMIADRQDERERAMQDIIANDEATTGAVK
jgi:hypothetical protein